MDKKLEKTVAIFEEKQSQTVSQHHDSYIICKFDRNISRHRNLISFVKVNWFGSVRKLKPNIFQCQMLFELFSFTADRKMNEFGEFQSHQAFKVSKIWEHPMFYWSVFDALKSLKFFVALDIVFFSRAWIVTKLFIKISYLPQFVKNCSISFLKTCFLSQVINFRGVFCNQFCRVNFVLQFVLFPAMRSLFKNVQYSSDKKLSVNNIIIWKNWKLSAPERTTIFWWYTASFCTAHTRLTPLFFIQLWLNQTSKRVPTCSNE